MFLPLAPTYQYRWKKGKEKIRIKEKNRRGEATTFKARFCSSNFSSLFFNSLYPFTSCLPREEARVWGVEEEKEERVEEVPDREGGILGEGVERVERLEGVENEERVAEEGKEEEEEEEEEEVGVAVRREDGREEVLVEPKRGFVPFVVGRLEREEEVVGRVIVRLVCVDIVEEKEERRERRKREKRKKRKKEKKKKRKN